MLLSEKKFRSLSSSLIFWFLLLSLLPMTLVAWFSYQQANISLTKAASEELEQSAALNVRFIQNWFDFRFMDLNNQADDDHSIDLLSVLIDGLKNSGKNLADYINSDDWNRQVDERQKDFITLRRRYDYIYDILLIDTQGNILYTIARESDLGSNLFHGTYADTRLAKSVTETLQNGQSYFSDIERYAPSDNILTGFVTAPVLDKSGRKLGVLAIQLRLDRLYKAMNFAINGSLIHYLVGEDQLLRSTLKHREWILDDVLKKAIDTRQAKIRFSEHGTQGQYDVHDYTGPAGQQVLGIHYRIKLPGVSWMLISEIDKTEALADAIWLGKVTFALVSLTALIVVLLAIFLSRRITRPIIQLSNTAMIVAEGDINTQVDIVANNEIGRLAEAFNHMLSMRQMHEQALQESTHQAQHTLAELEEQKFALDQHAIVDTTDVEGSITYANELFSKISGYSVDELMGQNHRMLNSGYHDKEFWAQLYRTVANGKVWHNEVCNKAKDGHLFWVETTIVPFKDEHGKPQSYIAIRTDITERKDSEQELISAKELAEAATLAKSEFLASMSHEIRTPMNGVLGMLGLLLNTHLNDEQRHRVTLAQSSGNALLTLINDILDFSKVEAGKLELEILDFNLRSLLGEFAEAMALQAHEKGLEVVLDVTGIEQSMIKGDPGRLRQILTNLVSNAIKFTSEGEILIFVELLPHSSSQEEPLPDNQLQLHCKVIDTGIGIPADKQKYLFDSFSQVDASTTRKYGGTGLGLAIAKKLSKLMGGDIQVSSEPARGSCFEFNILVECSAQSQLIIPEIDMTMLNLLIVDDNATNREVLRGQLEHWGAAVTEAEDGPTALRLCESRVQPNEPSSAESLFDIAFLDMQMPGMDGAALAKALKVDARFKNMKLVMMTSMSHRGDARFFSDLGFSAYFPKPTTTSDLFGALSVVAKGGEVLQEAQPLVTHHYLKTLADNKKARDQETPPADSLLNTDETWSADTHLLLVEDNRVNQLVASGILMDLGLQTDIAANGIEALECLLQAPEDAPYTLVFMDCQMPEMDGYEATRQIRAGQAGERYTNIPIIAMTANVMKGDREKCLAAGMSDYLSKPINTDGVYAKLQEWLNQQSQDLFGSDPVEPDAIASALVPAPIDLVWDKDAALNRMGGKVTRLLPLIELFLDDIPARLNELQAAIDEQNIEEIRRAAHTIKGVAANLSGLHLQQLAAQLELAAKTQGTRPSAQFKKASTQMNQELVQVCGGLIQLLTQYQTEQSLSSTAQSQQQILMNDAQLNTLLKALAEKLQQGDYIDSQELKPLKGGFSDDTIQALVKQLMDQIALFDSQEALKIINEIITLTGSGSCSESDSSQGENN